MDEDARYRWRRDGVEKLANSGRPAKIIYSKRRLDLTKSAPYKYNVLLTDPAS